MLGTNRCVLWGLCFTEKTLVELPQGPHSSSPLGNAVNSTRAVSVLFNGLEPPLPAPKSTMEPTVSEDI